MLKKITFLSLFLMVSITCSAFSNEQLMQAMRDEIKRSMEKLEVQGLKKPYYIEYKLTLRNSYSIKSSLGTINESNNVKTANLSVGVRVGSYKTDNTNFFDFGFSLFGSGDDEENFKGRNIPIEIDYKTLRRELWLSTDAAYKQVSEIFAKKEATLKNRIIKDTTSDFLQLKPEKYYDTSRIPEFNVNKFELLCKKLSGVFNDFGKINVSTVSTEYLPGTVYYVNSEGREYIKNDYYLGLEVVASTQADDGMPLMDFFSSYSRNPNELPTEDSLVKAIRSIAEKLTELRNAETLDEPYSGPILFEGQAASELFAQIFAPNLVTQREPMTEQGVQENERYTAFQSKIGGRVLPEFLSVAAIPSKNEYEKTNLLGQNKIDDEGVLSEDVILVKEGFLKNLLSCRVPTKRVRRTNGHQLGGAAMLSTIELTGNKDNSMSQKELTNKMLELCKDRELPYGIIVRKAMNQNIMFTTLFRLTMGDFPMTQVQAKVPLIEVYKKYADGREVLLRGCDAKGFTPQSFKDILKVGNRAYAMNYLAPAVSSPFVTGGNQYIGASVIVPDLLFEDGEIRSVESDFPKPPILANPIDK